MERRTFSAALSLAFGLGLVGFVLIEKPDIPLPAKESLFGCYRADGGPDWELGPSGLMIHQEEPLLLPFGVSYSKSGYMLDVGRPLASALDGTDVHFRIADRGIGMTYRTGERYFDRSGKAPEIEEFEVFHKSGPPLQYRRATDTPCP